jgi:hypothetical protein
LEFFTRLIAIRGQPFFMGAGARPLWETEIDLPLQFCETEFVEEAQRIGSPGESVFWFDWRILSHDTVVNSF